MKAGQHRSPDMLADHDLVPKVETWRVDKAIEHLGRVREVGLVVARRAGVGDVDGHPVTTPGPTRPLPVVGWERRDIPHQNRIECADVDAEFQSWGADQRVDGLAVALEQSLQAFALLGGNLRRMLVGQKHPARFGQHLEVVVVRAFVFPNEFPVAAPGEAFAKRRGTHLGAAASLAAPEAVVGEEGHPVGVNLMRPAAAGQGFALWAGQRDRGDEFEVAGHEVP